MTEIATALMRKAGVLLVLGFAAFILYWFTHSPQAHSRLWGENGELWSPSGRMTDYSFAGYRMGAALPRVTDPDEINVQKDFGAVGDGVADDTEAFVKALAAKTRGVIFVPPGRFRLTRPLFVTKGNVVQIGRASCRERV